MVAIKNNNLITIPLAETSDRIRFVEKDHPLIVKARQMGVSFGDE
jgi:6-phosphofructokinase 1